MTDNFDPNVPRLGYRCWNWDPNGERLTSVAMSGTWPADKDLKAKCAMRTKKGEAKHAPAHAKCSCGIYMVTHLDPIYGYIRGADVVGLVFGWGAPGRVVNGLHRNGDKAGFRTEFARVAGILLLDPSLTGPHRKLKKIAALYGVPAIVPHSVYVEDYRSIVTFRRDEEVVGGEDDLTRFNRDLFDMLDEWPPPDEEE